MSDNNKLIPVDYEQCQALKPNGASFMSFGDVPRHVRCTAKPKWVATERKPASDGQTGSMSVCANCKKKLIEQVGKDHAVFAKI